MRARLFWILSGAYVLIASGWIAWHASSEWDYPLDAGPPIHALTHGHIHEFLAARPLMGPFSLIVRAPFAALAQLTSNNGPPFYFDDYRFGVFPCMVAAGLLGLALARLMERRGASVWLRAAVVVLSVVNPVSVRAVHFGHPEEVLGAALLAGAAVAAIERRPYLAATLLALAVANKQWAVIGAPAVIVAIVLANDREQVKRAALVVLGIGALLLIPLLAVDASGVWTMTRQLADIRTQPVWPPDIWYSFMPKLTPAELHVFAADLRHMPDWLGLLARPALIAIGIMIPLLYARRVAEDVPQRALSLLALVMLLRCALDPADNSYYHVPFFVALLSADAIRGKLWATAVACVVLRVPTTIHFDAAQLSLYYMAWAVPFVVYLAGRTYGIDWVALLRNRGVRGPGVAPGARPSSSAAGRKTATRAP